jgi:hypothetical protein
MILTAVKESLNRSRAWVRNGVVCLLLLGFASACSEAGTAQQNTAMSERGKASVAQASVPSTAAPVANPNTGGGAAAAVAAPSAAASPAQEHLVGVGSATVVTVHGKIVSVNRAKKLVTLEGPNGKKVTVHVYNPYNLAAAKPGEHFVAKFYEIVTIRKLKRGESRPAASLAEGAVSAAPGQTPGAVAGTTVQLSVTIDAIDKDKETVAVKGPDGSVETVKVANPTNLKYVKVGDEIVITLSNVVSIWLEKESGA